MAQSMISGSKRAMTATTMRVASVLFQPPKRFARSHANAPAVRSGGGRAMIGAWRAVSIV
jgi:hypothetical protein